MYISINWIKDFVDLTGIDVDNLINRFTLSTAEVEGIEKKGFNTKGVVVGLVKSVEKHPQSDKLKIVQVDIGGKTIQSLCGAPNVAINQKIAFAPAGSMVQGVEVKPSVIADQKSEGVCLSEKELGISDDHSGLMLIEDNIEVGTDIKSFMDIEDVIFEVDNKSLTHRPDLWGHYGIAREVAALAGRPLKPLEVEELEAYANLPKLNIKVEDEEKCYRYSAIAIENITKKISSLNMRIRLFYCGTRGINLLADITNYIMMELGQPMHAFDKSIVDHVNVRTLKEQTFKTLDGVDRTIYDETLMICKDDAPIAIAGIMGGENTEIKDTTNSLFLESANFNPVTTRKSAVKLGLRTEASARYEKTLDPEMTTVAIARYIYLLKQVDKDIKVVSAMTDVYLKKHDTVSIEITKDYINNLIGINIGIDEMEKILTSLGFGVNVSGEKMTVSVPSYRATKDISMKADLVEEISRIYGYDNIVPETKLGPVKIVIGDESQKIDNNIKDVLSQKYGMNEVHSYIWNDKKLNRELKIQTNDNIKIINSLNADNNVLRDSMIPSLLNTLNKNVKLYNEINIFEIGKVFEYPNKGENCIEKKNLGIIMSSKTLPEKELLQKAQEVITNIFVLNKNVRPVMKELDANKYNWLNPINSASITYDGNELGYVSVLNLMIKNAIDKKINAVIIELELGEFLKISKNNVAFEEATKYQTTSIDLSLIVDKKVKYETIETYIKDIHMDNLMEYRLVDIFEDEAKLPGQKSVTMKFILGAKDHTLVGDEITESMNKLIDIFEKNGIIIRK